MLAASASSLSPERAASHHAPAALRDLLGERRADPGRGAGDDDDLSLVTWHGALCIMIDSAHAHRVRRRAASPSRGARGRLRQEGAGLPRPAATTSSTATRPTSTAAAASARRCNTGKHCVAATDCRSRLCTAGACAAPSCSDGIVNGSESDVDCGGPDCAGLRRRARLRRRQRLRLARLHRRRLSDPKLLRRLQERRRNRPRLRRQLPAVRRLRRQPSRSNEWID